MTSKKDRVIFAIAIGLLAGYVTFDYPRIFKIAEDFAVKYNQVIDTVKGEQNNG